MPHTGLRHPLRLQLRAAVQDILVDIFGQVPFRDLSHEWMNARNRQIVARLQAGDTPEELARAYGLSLQRIYQLRS